jgi:hypothetical protein
VIPVAVAVAEAPSAPPAAPADIAAGVPGAVLVGRGSLRFFGMSIYEARLWAAPGFDPAAYAEQPFALELRYQRRLCSDAIAERSIAEMRRGGAFSDEQARVWLAWMRAAFPDVAAGDRLNGIHDGQGGVRFHFNGRPSPAQAEPAARAIRDVDFARLFFGIWLAPTSSVPALRQELIGGLSAPMTTRMPPTVAPTAPRRTAAVPGAPDSR